MGLIDTKDQKHFGLLSGQEKGSDARGRRRKKKGKKRGSQVSLRRKFGLQ